jgi:hypothetical protein
MSNLILYYLMDCIGSGRRFFVYAIVIQYIKLLLDMLQYVINKLFINIRKCFLFICHCIKDILHSFYLFFVLDIYMD